MEKMSFMGRAAFCFIGLVLIMTSLSCHRNHYKVNLSGIDVETEVARLEKDLFSVSPLELRDNLPEIKAKYGEFLTLFSKVINIGDVSSPEWEENLISFVTDRMIWDAWKRVEEVFPEISDIESELGGAFSHYRYHFPEAEVPAIYTAVTGFNNSIIVGDSIIGIGIDRYLGADTDFYKMLGIYSYLARRMSKEYIVPDCMYAWAATEWDYHLLDYGTDNLFSRIIHEGKLFYFVKSMMPDATEERLFGFTEEQINFCRNNEDNMWSYMIEHDLLFSTDQLTIRKLASEAPFTTYFTRESPGRAALWIGFRMVEQFMKRNSAVTLAELMEVTDYQSILSGARYDP